MNNFIGLFGRVYLLIYLFVRSAYLLYPFICSDFMSFLLISPCCSSLFVRSNYLWLYISALRIFLPWLHVLLLIILPCSLCPGFMFSLLFFFSKNLPIHFFASPAYLLSLLTPYIYQSGPFNTKLFKFGSDPFGSNIPLLDLLLIL